jgi:hypothetical protein
MLKIERFWFDRFTIYFDGQKYCFKDSIFNSSRSLTKFFLEQHNIILDRKNLFLNGFLKSHFELSEIDESLFFDWQHPALTEKYSFLNHSRFLMPSIFQQRESVYVGAPWASIIDNGFSKFFTKFSKIKLFFSGFKGALSEFGIPLNIHTVCQHVFWERCIPIWIDIGITHVWLSHMPSYVDPDLPFKIHPWALYAVNIEDPDRREGLEIGKDPASKSLLASFIGAHAAGYISDVRLRLRQFADEPGFLIRVTDKWHFEDVVYKHQVQGLPLEENYVIDDSVREYNAVLSDSVFALCPSGAGPNSIRLWEALAVGSIPVLLGNFPVLPMGGSLPEIDWDSIVLKVSDDQFSKLPQILSAMPMDEIRTRQKRGMEAYALVREQRCF